MKKPHVIGASCIAPFALLTTSSGAYIARIRERISGKKILLAIALAALASGAHATVISWGAAMNITGDADVSTQGTLVAAYNFAGPQTIVNGVTFESWILGAGTIDKGTCPTLPATGTYTAGANTLSYSLNNCGGDIINNNLDTTSSKVAPFSSLSTGYQSLLGSAGERGDKDITLTMGGLTLGVMYEVQFWVNDSREQFPFSFYLTIDGTNYLDPNPTGSEGALGQYITGTFMADAASQSLIFRGDEVGIFNGFQLRALPAAAVPEPASGWLVALGLPGLLIRYRHSRQRLSA